MSKNKSMLKKFISHFVFCIVIPFLIISIIINSLYEKVLITNYDEKVQQVLRQISIYIESEIKRISLDAAKVSNERRLLYLVNNWFEENDCNERFNTSQKIDEMLDYLFAYQGKINSIVFFSKYGEKYVYGNPHYIDEVNTKNLWYKKCLNTKDKVFNNFKNSKEQNNANTNFLVGISPNFSNFNSSINFIYFEIKTEVFDSIYLKFKNDSMGKMFLIDSLGTIFTSSDKSLIGQNIFKLNYINNSINTDFHKINLNPKNNYISKYTSKKTGFTIVNTANYNIITQYSSNIFRILLIIFIIFNILFILYSKFYFKDIIKPIKELINTMKKVKTGKLYTVINTNSNITEIIALENNYNMMICDIKNLINERDLKERQRSKEEIKALQAQINPHFIYNTLNVIKLMAMMSRCENIKNVTDSFMKLLSATFKSSSKFITVQEELKYIQNYIQIMKVRLGNDFTIKFKISNNVKSLYVIKLILQPIVENAIIHGLLEIDRDKKIIIDGNIIENNLVLEVEDNGIGMSPIEIKNAFENKNSSRTSFNGIGIKNIEKRIKLNYGKKYGLQIHSEKDKYTNVKLILPIIKEVD